jgi:hypothetical protein
MIVADSVATALLIIEYCETVMATAKPQISPKELDLTLISHTVIAFKAIKGPFS